MDFLQSGGGFSASGWASDGGFPQFPCRYVHYPDDYGMAGQQTFICLSAPFLFAAVRSHGIYSGALPDWCYCRFLFCHCSLCGGDVDVQAVVCTADVQMILKSYAYEIHTQAGCRLYFSYLQVLLSRRRLPCSFMIENGEVADVFSQCLSKGYRQALKERNAESIWPVCNLMPGSTLLKPLTISCFLVWRRPILISVVSISGKEWMGKRAYIWKELWHRLRNWRNLLRQRILMWQK